MIKHSTPTYQTEDGRDMFIFIVESACDEYNLPILSCYSFDREGELWFEAHGVTYEWLKNVWGGLTGIYELKKTT